ncbi:hypothetical protein [Sphingomonas sp. 22176]|uniref:hypothetical protein n=1 Tax=Sphingomonas sp. 22176 TaxID=3453884 RepID=UPI003F86FF06
MEWLVAAGLILCFTIALPPALRAAKRSLRGNKRMAGIAMSLGMAFAFLHDPRANERIEQVRKSEKDAEDAGSTAAGSRERGRKSPGSDAR